MQKSFEERALFSETNILFKVINYKNIIYNFHSFSSDKSIILCKILYNVLTVSYLPNLIYFPVELSHSSCKSIRTAPINRLAEAWLGKIRMIFSLLRTSWFRRSRRLVLFSRL